MEEEYVRKLSDKQIIKRLLGFARPYYKYFLVGIMLVLISVPLALYSPLLIREILDKLISEDFIYQDITLNLLLMILIFIINAIATYCLFYILQKAGQMINRQIREAVFWHIENMSTNQFNLTPVGKLVTRVTNDVNSITELYASVIIGFIRNSYQAVIALGYMFIVSWRLALLAIMVIPLLILATFFFRKSSRKAYRLQRTYNTEVNASLSEHLMGVKITQIFNQEANEIAKFQEKTQQLYQSNLKAIRNFALFRPFVYLLHVISLVLVLYFGSLKVMEGLLTIGSLLIFYDYLYYFYNPVRQISEQFDVLQSSFASAEKIFTILDCEPEIVDANQAIELDIIRGKIEFRNVWFKYIEDEWILKDLSFTVYPNETVAFIGETGSGKSTILSLITRNYDIQKGQILIDDIDIRQIKIASIRRHISQMLQDVFLFSGTIESNIKLREDYSFEAMNEAAVYVNADKFIKQLPRGYLSEVYEGGNNFSAGQRQLLSFTRAIIHQPQIIILDEATANIDTETEQLIQNSLAKIMNIGTMLIVAHRLSTIQNAHRIIVLDKGKIVESGNHEQLLQKQGHYYKLHLMQYTNK